jgi:hypothetical protein
MERFLLIRNKSFFDKHGIITINAINDIPNKSSILFIGSHEKSIDNLNTVTRYFEHIKQKQYNYIIILGKGDGILNKDINIPKNVKRIYATNTNYNHPIIKFLPMGCDFRSIDSFKRADIKNENRDILCYCNYSLNTHPDRKYIYNILKNKKFITIENMGTFLNYSISRDEFFTKLGRSKFTICPRGNAIDTFRFYDSIYSGSIPIVVKTHFHNLDIFNNVPILFLETIEDYNNLTEIYLEAKYTELSEKRKDFYENFDFNVFINKIKEMCLL